MRIQTLTVGCAALVATLSAATAQGPTKLPQFDRRTPAVLAVENVGPAVVNIRGQAAFRPRGRNFSMFQMFELPTEVETDPRTGQKFADRSLGSGVIIHADGYVISNEHVVAGSDRIRVKLSDGRELTATLLNANRDNDLALLRLEGEGPFPFAELGDSDQLFVGETTLAMGNPFGLQSSVTDGLLSATGRSVRFQGREVFSDFLQTSALINPGNSGGPLLDINGRVIGINVAIDNRGPGIGYAIPVNRVKDVTATLLAPEMTKQAWIGLDVHELQPGSVIAQTVPEDGPAYAAGVRPGDRILTVGETRVTGLFDLNAALQKYRPGGQVPLRYERRGSSQSTLVAFQPLPLESLVRGDQTIVVLGMKTADLTPAAASRLHIPDHLIGPVVLDVEENTPAAEIDFRKGDVVVQVGQVATPTQSRMVEALRYYRRRATSVPVKVYREDAGEMQGTLAFPPP